MKPFAESCVENCAPILAVLKRCLADRTNLLEIGSGTGQHAVYFAPHFPRLTWQTGDRPEYHAGIRMWLDEANLQNVLPPIDTDARADSWKTRRHDAVFTANTLHIMDWGGVEALFDGVGRVLEPGGVFAVYGPFHYHGKPTSESNVRFDTWLRARDPASGVRDFADLVPLATDAGLELAEDVAMPANNRTLIWRKLPA